MGSGRGKEDLSGLSLKGTLAPELGYLDNLKSLILHTNHLSGVIPAEFGRLTKLEVLDLSDNNFTGVIPTDIAKIVSLKRLLLCGNNFEGIIPPEFEEYSSLSELQYDEYLASVTNRKFGHRKACHCDAEMRMEYKVLVLGSACCSSAATTCSSADEGPDDELFPAQEVLLHIQTRIVDLVPDKDNIVTIRLLIASSDIKCLDEGDGSLAKLKKLTGADAEVLPKEKVPAFVSGSDELVQCHC